ncbi:unnamed protein product [Oikopleura dioica]|uniref:non-specific serine/threonine protein kinase n=1 Tax=Oikopleura dioica TaxID=34765 RepID=E4YEA4_OIKDI|nr:unnamed protein product [Oikopleura dioica]
MAVRDRQKGNYVLEKRLGAGSFGEVFTCWHNKRSVYSEEECLVIKIINIGPGSKSSDGKDPKDDAKREANLLRQLNHKYIIQFHDSFIERESFCIVTEFCNGGDLEHFIVRRRDVNEKISSCLVIKWMKQMTEAIKYMHTSHPPILHRDLKSRNVFISFQDVKIGDLGVSRVLHESFAKSFLGTPYYMAPEMIKDAKYDTKADIWSLGCIVFELVTLKRAYTSDSLMRLMYKIVEDPAPRISKDEVADLKLWPVIDILTKMLDKSAKSRPSAAQILQDSIFSDSRTSSATSRSSTGSRGSRPGSGKEMISMTSKPDFTETVKQLDTIKAKTFARHWSQTSDKQSNISSEKTPTASIDFALPEEIDEYASHLQEAEAYSDSESDSSDDDSSSDEYDSEEDEIIKEARLTLTDQINGSLYQEEKFDRIDPSTDLASGVLTSKYERLKKQCIDTLGKVNFLNAYNFFRRIYEKKEFPEDIVSELGDIVGPLATHCMIVEELIMLEDQLRKN